MENGGDPSEFVVISLKYSPSWRNRFFPNCQDRARAAERSPAPGLSLPYLRRVVEAG
jgi:hypothetical protein